MPKKGRKPPNNTSSAQRTQAALRNASLKFHIPGKTRTEKPITINKLVEVTLEGKDLNLEEVTLFRHEVVDGNPQFSSEETETAIKPTEIVITENGDKHIILDEELGEIPPIQEITSTNEITIFDSRDELGEKLKELKKEGVELKEDFDKIGILLESTWARTDVLADHLELLAKYTRQAVEGRWVLPQMARKTLARHNASWRFSGRWSKVRDMVNDLEHPELTQPEMHVVNAVTNGWKVREDMYERALDYTNVVHLAHALNLGMKRAFKQIPPLEEKVAREVSASRVGKEG